MDMTYTFKKWLGGILDKSTVMCKLCHSVVVLTGAMTLRHSDSDLMQTVTLKEFVEIGIL